MIVRSFLICLAMVVPAAAAAAADAPTRDRDELATAAGPLVVHPLEHATMVLEWNGRTVAVDPVGGGPRFAEFPAPGLVLITHQHGDHLSVETVEAIAADSTAIIAPPAVAEKLPQAWRDRVTILRNGERTSWSDIVIEAVPAYNLTPERQQFHPKGRDNGYVLTLGGTRIYISGDTEDIPEMRALKDIDAAFVCMNLPYTMDVSAAADAVLEFAPKVVYPYHSRGTGGLSDLDEFRRVVAADPAIEVRVLDWYPGTN